MSNVGKKKGKKEEKRKKKQDDWKKERTERTNQRMKKRRKQNEGMKDTVGTNVEILSSRAGKSTLDNFTTCQGHAVCGCMAVASGGGSCPAPSKKTTIEE